MSGQGVYTDAGWAEEQDRITGSYYLIYRNGIAQDGAVYPGGSPALQGAGTAQPQQQPGRVAQHPVRALRG